MNIDIDDDLLAARCHANCIEAAVTSARRAPDVGEIVERNGVLLYATASDFPILANGAFRVDPRVPAERVIETADAWFAERGRGWSLGTTSWADADRDLIEAALAREMVPTVDMPGMVCDERLADAAAPDGIEVRVITAGTDDGAAFVAMIDQAYTSLGLPAGVLAGMAPNPSALIPPCHEVTIGAFENGVLLSGAQVLFSHGIAGVYAVGTAESGRGRGLAELVTRTVTNIGFDGGAPCVTLQASSMGEPIYRRMGYREIYRYVSYTRFA
jgi:hypothetical protein